MRRKFTYAADAPPLLRYGAAILASTLALVLTWLLLPLTEQNLFLLFFAAVALSAWYGGLGPGLFVIAFTVVTVDYLFIPPYFSLDIGLINFLRLGGFAFVALLIILLTERSRQAEAAAHEQGERFHVTLASIGDAVMVTDTAGSVTFMNPVAEALTGWTLDEAAGHPITEVFRIVEEHTRAPVESPSAIVLRAGIVVGLVNHTILIVRDGSERSIEDSGAPIRDAHGAIVGVVLVFRDISERKRAEQALALELARRATLAVDNARLYAAEQQARARAEAAVRARDQFLSVAAHELRTPLTSLLGYTQLLQRHAERDGTLPERDQRALGVIVSQVTRLNRMVQALLNIARLETGQLSIERGWLDLCALARRVAEEVQPTLSIHTVECVTPDQPLVVEGDELRLEQVLQNLVQNAIKYSPAGGPITLRVEQRGEQVCVAVTDQGIGIPADALSRLFQRFYRADNVEREQIGGMGIGLYVVKEIVALHGGSVTVESVEGVGSTFTVSLPRTHGVSGKRADDPQNQEPKTTQRVPDQESRMEDGRSRMALPVYPKSDPPSSILHPRSSLRVRNV